MTQSGWRCSTSKVFFSSVETPCVSTDEKKDLMHLNSTSLRFSWLEDLDGSSQSRLALWDSVSDGRELYLFQLF